jgi:CRISPR-associated endonuclease Cas1
VNSKLALAKNTTQVTAPARPHSGLLVLSGYGIKVAVESGHLVVEDGVGSARRRGRFSRATAGFKRLVILGHSGIVSLEALRWLHDIGASFIQIDADGQLINCAGPAGLNDARLRRAQALAAETGNGTGSGTGTRPGIGFGIARDLIRQKLTGQVRVLEGLRGKAAIQIVCSAIERIAAVESIDKLRNLEGDAAIAYWGAWRDLDVVFVERDRNRIPEHWVTFGVRRSLLTGNPRNATNPANAILNYLYSILESEARIAALTMGLDPGMGVMHADQRGRDSLACDVMEAIRPKVDAYVLDFFERRAFKKNDFFETREGVCRLMPRITGELIETAERWSKELAPITEFVAKSLSRHVPTPLTESNRSAGRAKYARSRS